MITTVEVGMICEAIVKAAKVFSQNIKEGMIAVQQIKEGYYEQVKPPSAPKSPGRFSSGQD
jgi:hypothetical protein